MLRNKLLRQSPVGYWTPDILEEIVKNNPMNDEDVCTILEYGHYVKVHKGSHYLDEGICSPWMNEISIPPMNPIKEIRSLIHELLHLTFPYKTKVHPDYLKDYLTGGHLGEGHLPQDANKKFESIIETEEERIYNENLMLTRKIQKLFNFPKGEVYPITKPIKLLIEY